jgi:hypothetical protein
MSYYLLDNPPASRQFYPSRVGSPTWAVGVHTTESIMDTVWIDTGAENVAGFISRRGDAGSYVVIVDSDSTVRLVPDTYTTMSIGVKGFNSATWSIALACRQSELDPDHWWTQAAIARAGAEIRRMWTEQGIDIVKAAVWRPAADALQMACLFNHGDAQPADRRDAFVRSPQQDRLQQMLVEAILGAPAPRPQEWDEMATREDLRVVVAEEGKRDCLQAHDAQGKPYGPVYMVRKDDSLYAFKDPEEHNRFVNEGFVKPVRLVNGATIQRLIELGS